MLPGSHFVKPGRLALLALLVALLGCAQLARAQSSDDDDPPAPAPDKPDGHTRPMVIPKWDPRPWPVTSAPAPAPKPSQKPWDPMADAKPHRQEIKKQLAALQRKPVHPGEVNEFKQLHAELIKRAMVHIEKAPRTPADGGKDNLPPLMRCIRLFVLGDAKEQFLDGTFPFGCCHLDMGRQIQYCHAKREDDITEPPNADDDKWPWFSPPRPKPSPSPPRPKPSPPRPRPRPPRPIIPSRWPRPTKRPTRPTTTNGTTTKPDRPPPPNTQTPIVPEEDQYYPRQED